MRKAIIGVAAVIAASAVVTPTARAEYSVQAFQSSYQGYDIWTHKCSSTQTIYGYEPTTPGSYPVLVYLHATLDDWWNNKSGQVVAQLAASQGFVALAPSYSSFLSNIVGRDGHAGCIFGTSNPTNVVAQACSRSDADCSHGIVAAGFSQGGSIALRAANANAAVRAAWVMGVLGAAGGALVANPSGTRALPNSEIRVVDGATDVSSSTALAGVQAIAGETCSSPDCLQADGSGYYVVQGSEVADGVADHCFWMQARSVNPSWSCTVTPTIANLDPGFTNPAVPWSLNASVDWLRAQLK